MSDVILETSSLTKEFKGFTAVSDVNLAVRRGSIHALIGPNGHDITREQPAQIPRRGVIRSFQISAVFPQLSLLENVRLGLQRKLGSSFYFWRSERTLHRLNEGAMQLLSEVGLAELAGGLAVNLPDGGKRAPQ